MDFLQGRSERNGQAYVCWYVEPLSDTERSRKPLSSASETQKPSSLLCRDEGLTRFVVPPWFGVERPLRPFPTLHSPVTWARRNPLLSFHGFGSEASSTGSRTGLHHPPALFAECHDRQHSAFQTDVYYSSSSPLKLWFADRLFSFRFAGQFTEHAYETFDRSQQGIAGEHDK